MAASRSEAAAEAKAIYKSIKAGGWNAVTRAQGRIESRTSPDASPSKADLGYWKERLIHSKYREGRLPPAKEFSVRMEHEGVYQYFPLGTDDAGRAAAQALEIYRTIATKGWEAAYRQFPREITVSVFWSTSPVACTYTTLFTFAGDPPPNPPQTTARTRSRRRVFVIEADAEVRGTLDFWLDAQPGFECAGAFNSAPEALDAIVHSRPDLVLVNRALPEMPAAEFIEALKRKLPELAAFMYGIYQDSDQIFIQLSGVTAGYIFRRRRPTELFEPIRGAMRQKIPSVKELHLQIRDYFQSLFGFTLPGDETPTLAILTAREQEILSYVSKGFLDKEIADALGISVWTVHNHLKHIYEKLNVHNRTEAVLKYLQK